MFLASFAYRILAGYIQTEGVRKLLQELDPHKATELDNISANLFKLTALQIAPLLVLVFTASVIQGKLPDDWKLAYITPIFKKGNRRSAANYLQISITSICCKVLASFTYFYTSRKF